MMTQAKPAPPPHLADTTDFVQAMLACEVDFDLLASLLGDVQRGTDSPSPTDSVTTTADSVTTTAASTVAASPSSCFSWRYRSSSRVQPRSRDLLPCPVSEPLRRGDLEGASMHC